MSTEKSIKQKRSFIGTVEKAAMNKTITVRVDNMNLNKKYQKRSLSSRKYHVHDEHAAAKAGNVVNFVECRPLSKTKRWRLVSVVK